jgi:hypothetical protein
MIRSTDGLIRHSKTVKAKLLFLINKNKYSMIKEARLDL